MRALLCLLLLAGCGTAYNAGTTYAKLKPGYPQIGIASSAVPPEVDVIKGDRLDLYLPAQRTGRLPAIVLVHGGGWRSGERANLAPMAIRLAQRGYASATVSYRLSGEAKYPAAVDDVRTALLSIRSREEIDPDRIAIAGASAGGQLASLVGVTGAPVKAIINIDGLSDFTSTEALRHEDDPAKNPSAAGAWFGGRYAEKSALWREASPTFYVGPATPPILFIGSGQPRFSVGREAMIEKMTSFGVPSEVVIFPGTPHSFWLFDPWLDPTVDAIARFLAAHMPAPPWMADLGDGRYQNPILHADYSDPDVIRVGDTYFMTSSSFSNVPGLPLLESKDMVNWALVGHALPRLVPHQAFATHQPGMGVWAPSLRHHAGKFWIFYPDPDAGVYVITADRFAGPWSAPHLLLPGKGIIDPTPLWDDDGKAWLMHAWAKSRAGFNNVLTLRQMAPDGRSLIGASGAVVIDGNKLAGYRTLEGPKFYKHEGYYYVFAPAGGVEEGWQSVFRARRIEGPYEERIVLSQGDTPVNGPHQGAWVRAADGRDWFFHFQDKRAYGRVVHLQPMRWEAGWPVMGNAGKPVALHAKPVAGFAARAPATSDEFSSPTLGLQWQWNANWDRSWYALDAGRLRLFANPSVLSQKLPAPQFVVDTKVTLHGKGEAGLILIGVKSVWIGLRGNDLMMNDETILAGVTGAAYLRVEMSAGGIAQFSYSLDNLVFTPAGKPFTATMGRWVGAQIGLLSRGPAPSFADVDYFRVSAKTPHAIGHARVK